MRMIITICAIFYKCWKWGERREGGKGYVSDIRVIMRVKKRLHLVTMLLPTPSPGGVSSPPLPPPRRGGEAKVTRGGKFFHLFRHDKSEIDSLLFRMARNGNSLPPMTERSSPRDAIRCCNRSYDGVLTFLFNIYIWDMCKYIYIYIFTCKEEKIDFSDSLKVIIKYER